MVYLIHIDAPVGSNRHSARHYLGYTNDLRRRFEEHSSGAGSPLLAAAAARGISFSIVRTWPEGTRTLERQLKRSRHHTRLCPTCNAAALVNTER